MSTGFIRIHPEIGEEALLSARLLYSPFLRLSVKISALWRMNPSPVPKVKKKLSHKIRLLWRNAAA